MILPCGGSIYVSFFILLDLSKEINTMSEEYMANVRDMDAAKRTLHLKKIENAFVKSREYGDDKVQLAMQTYEMVSTCFIFFINQGLKQAQFTVV